MVLRKEMNLINRYIEMQNSREKTFVVINCFDEEKIKQIETIKSQKKSQVLNFCEQIEKEYNVGGDLLKLLEYHFNFLNLFTSTGLISFQEQTKNITRLFNSSDWEPFCKLETDQNTYLFSSIPTDTVLDYCSCSLEDEGYNQAHDCCGNICTWEIPVVTVINSYKKMTDYIYFGLQRYLW